MYNGDNPNAIRLKSGGWVSIYAPGFNGGQWGRLGTIMSGKIDYKEDASEIVPAHGFGFEIPGKTKCSVEVVCGETSDEMVKAADLLKGQICQIVIYNGLLNGKRQYFVIAEGISIVAQVIDMKANSHQTLQFSFSVRPNKGLPENFSLGSIGWTGAHNDRWSLNPYYVTWEESENTAIDVAAVTSF